MCYIFVPSNLSGSSGRRVSRVDDDDNDDDAAGGDRGNK